jgi:hypothetical protein
MFERNEEHEKVEVTKAYLNARLAEIQKLKEEVAGLKSEIMQHKMAQGIAVDEPF